MSKEELLKKLCTFKDEIVNEYSVWEKNFIELGKFDISQFAIKCCLLKKFICKTQILQIEYNKRIVEFNKFAQTSTYLRGVEYLFHNEKALEGLSKKYLTENGLYFIFDPTHKESLSFIGTMYDYMGNVNTFRQYVDNKGLYYYLKFMLAKEYDCEENSDILKIEEIISNNFKPFTDFADFFFFDKMFTKDSKIFETGIQLKMLIIAPLKVIQDLYDYIYNMQDDELNVTVEKTNNSQNDDLKKQIEQIIKAEELEVLKEYGVHGSKLKEYVKFKNAFNAQITRILDRIQEGIPELYVLLNCEKTKKNGNKYNDKKKACYEISKMFKKV